VIMGGGRVAFTKKGTRRMEQSMRTHACGELRLAHVGQKVKLAGWVLRRRDHGGLIFVDLRDRWGVVQVVFSPEVAGHIFSTAEKLRNEYVISVAGEVRTRLPGMANPNLATGEVEVYANDMCLLNEAKTPPFQLDKAEEVDESLRLRHRYLDLRRPQMQETLILRHKVTKAVRDYLDKEEFLEIETPMLTRSTPEGARDYLVPSRVHAGAFYALPQSPQIYKQLLMMGGLERYFQIVRCFRDEDLRADRQPEFTQIDIEMSFVNSDDVMRVMESLIAHVFKEVGVEVQLPIKRLSYDEAMTRYGSDKPDLRFDLPIVNVTDIVADSGFKVFADAVASGKLVKGINAKGAGTWPRREIDLLPAIVAQHGAKGLAWLVVEEGGQVRSSIAKFFSPKEISDLITALQAEPGDLLCFVASDFTTVSEALGRLRLYMADKLGLIKPNCWEFVWVVDWPLFEYDTESRRYTAAHHPFTAPIAADLPLLQTDPAQVRAQAYDLVLNGVELGGGSIRINDRNVQEAMFKALSMSEEEAQTKFGFLLEALEYGAPPHGGVAFGLDRMIMLMSGRDSIRDCIAFPKTQSAMDLLMAAPAPVSEAQLKELNVRVVLPQRVCLPQG
jgi:aspartyl-tRNA synthetase